MFTEVQLVEWLSTYGYYILIPILIIEGTVIGFVAGALASVGVFNPFILLAVFVGVRIVTDTVVYMASRYATSYVSRLPFAQKIITRLASENGEKSELRLFVENHFGKTLFLAKVLPAPSLDTALLIAAGTLDIPARRVYTAILLGQPIWSGLVIGLGYFFGDSIQNPEKVINIIGFGIGLIIVLVLVYNKYLHNYLFERSKMGQLLKK